MLSSFNTPSHETYLWSSHSKKMSKLLKLRCWQTLGKNICYHCFRWAVHQSNVSLSHLVPDEVILQLDILVRQIPDYSLDRWPIKISIEQTLPAVISPISCRLQSASWAVADKAMYSASAVDRATQACFRLLQLTAAPLN